MAKILGIDPGTEKSGYVIWDGEKVYEKDWVSNLRLVSMIHNGIAVDRIVIEMVEARGMPIGKETLDTVVWIGRYYEAALGQYFAVALVYRRDIKIHLCGSAKAKPANISRVLKDRFGEPYTLAEVPQTGKRGQPIKSKLVRVPGVLDGMTDHTWAALAAAVYFNDTQGPVT